MYYQKALIAVVNDFNNQDIYKNPALDSVLFDIRLLDNLKRKAQALELLAMQQVNHEIKLKSMKKSLETIDLALQLISRIRNNYMPEESRIYLADNEKETYLFATRIANNLYSLTGETFYLQNMYNTARQAKSAVLRNEITDNELFYSVGIPDTLRQMHNSLLADIAAYNNLIRGELQKSDPDYKKTDIWKDALFEMNRRIERMDEEINKLFPQYRDLLQKTEPISLDKIQSNLKKDETLIEYFLSNQYTKDGRRLYIFTITKDSLNFYGSDLDSLFLKNVKTIREGTVHDQAWGNLLYSYRNYTDALFNMYNKLIKPVENQLAGHKLIIVPDEEIAYLPFDAFLKSIPDSNQINYEGLPYLIYSYAFSYGYSSSLVFNKDKNLTKRKKVFAFSPEYRTNLGISANKPVYLGGTGKEINAIYKWFHGKAFIGDQASETNFKSLLQQSAIFHLAMHSLSDSVNSKYSCMIFETVTDTVEDGKLYNYEISLSRIKSPMVVLSACNTGTGTLYHGEGLMSLARGFILAGASSVIKTFWDVNDDASAKIITDFYYFLSRGKEKDEALRRAKLKFLKSSPPTYANPYYWAAYEVMGEKEPIARKYTTSKVIVFGVLFLLSTGSLINYFRRRRSFLA